MHVLNSAPQPQLLKVTNHLITLGQHLLNRQSSDDALMQSVQNMLTTLQQLQEWWQALQEQEKNRISAYNNLNQLREKLTSLVPTFTLTSDLKPALNGSKKIIHLVYPMTSCLEELLTLLEPITTADELKKENKSLSRPSIDPYSIEYIAKMVAEASLTEPEWMERTGMILVVDANHNTSSALHRRLVKDGHQVRVVENPSQILGELASHQIDVLIIDIATVGASSPTFFHDFRRHQNTEYIPIIAMGPLTDTEAITWSIEAGADDYLPKPPNPVLLRARVRSAIEKKVAYENRLLRLKELQETRQNLESAIGRLADGFALFDAYNRLVMYNDNLLTFYPHLKDHPRNLEKNGLHGMTFEELLRANLAAGIYIFDKSTPPLASNERHQSWIFDKITRFVSPSGQWEETLEAGFALQATSYRTPDGGGVLMLRDISEKKADQQRLAFMAYHDPLTGLANRELFHQRLKQALEKKPDNKDFLSVLFLDLDGFKDINDTYGHEVGDWLLTQVAQRLRHWVREQDMVARLGGDEFSIILSEVSSYKTIIRIAERILASLSAPYQKNGDTLRIGVSIGIAIDQEGTREAETLINQADMAMYAAKQAGKGQFFVHPELSTQNKF